MTSQSTITVLLVDDHAVVRAGCARLFERTDDIEVVGEAASFAEAYRIAPTLRPDVVVMDISLPEVSGIEGLRRMVARTPGACILVYSFHDEPVYARHAFAAGARGYLTKASAPALLVDAVRTVAGGKLFVGPDIAQVLAQDTVNGREAGLMALSPREFEIARLLAEGHPVGEVAQRLSLSVKTVGNHQSNIRQKLGARNAADFVRIAAKSGLLERDN